MKIMSDITMVVRDDLEEMFKEQDAVKNLAHYLAYKIDGRHYAVDQKYWRIAREMIKNIPSDPKDTSEHPVMVTCPDFGKFDIDTHKCSVFDEDGKMHNCPAIDACGLKAGIF